MVSPEFIHESSGVAFFNHLSIIVGILPNLPALPSRHFVKKKDIKQNTLSIKMKSLSFQHPRNRRFVKTNQNVVPFRSRFIFIINHHMNCQFVIHLLGKDPHTFWSNVWKGEDQGWLTGLHVDYPCSCGVNSLHNSLVNSQVHFSEFTTQWCLLLSEFNEQLHNSLHVSFTAQLHVQFGMTGEEGHT